jgi:hypothetical protein
MKISQYHQFGQDQGTMVYGSVVDQVFASETHKKIEYHKNKAVFASTNRPTLELNLDVVKAAADTYKISSDINDYILVPLPIVTSDIPNRNLQTFPHLELSYFAPEHGNFVYQTFVGKALFADHVNQDPTKSRGVIVDASYQYIPKYDVWKIMCVTLWDRTKDPKLAQDILNRKRTGYSMGSMVNTFLCSICGKVDNQDAHSCEHMRSKGRLFGEDQRLAYQMMVGCTFFEISSVADPADPTALSQDVFA